MNWESIIVALISVAGALIGTFVGASLSNKSQENVISRQIEWDKEKSLLEQRNQRTLIYNKILEREGKGSAVTPLGGAFVEFDIDHYKEKIRPLLYEGLHVLHEDIAKVLGEIDYLIQQQEFHQEPFEIEESHFLAEKYHGLIKMIEKQVKQERENHFLISNTQSK